MMYAALHLLQLQKKQIHCVCRARSFSAKKDFGALMKMMPLEVMMPTTGQLTLTLPAGGAAEKSHNPFGSLISIAGIKDEVVVMPSLQRPKKVL